MGRSSKRVSIAVLMTCFNRQSTTLRCLTQLFSQQSEQEVYLDVFLVDDGNDGTADQVAERFPRVHVVRGNGKLFWCGGMRVAFEAAVAMPEQHYDYHLWLNDDINMSPTALTKLLEIHQALALQGKPDSVVVGTFVDPTSAKVTYGGVIRKGLINLLSFRVVGPMQVPTACDTFNGNMVLVPDTVVQKVGNLERRFSHSMGDFDYGLRVRRCGGSVWIAPGIVGTCSRNSPRGTWLDETLSFQERWRRVLSPKGLPPREVLYFYRTHGGWLWPLNYLRFYLRVSLVISRSIFTRLGVH